MYILYTVRICYKLYILLESVISYISYIYIRIYIVLYCIIYSNYIIIPVFLFQRSTPCHVQVHQTLNGLKCAWLGLAGGAPLGRRIQRAFGPDLRTWPGRKSPQRRSCWRRSRKRSPPANRRRFRIGSLGIP